MSYLAGKAGKVLFFSVLTAMLLAVTAFASDVAIGAGCTTGSSLRLRSEPSTASSVVTMLDKSVAVAILDDSTDGWYKISYNGNTGYVSAEYVDYTPIDGEVAEVAVVEETTEVMSAVAASAQPRDAVVDGSSYINLRTDASNSADIITTLDEGTELTVLSVDGEWCCVDVTWDDPSGYSSVLPDEFTHQYFNVTSDVMRRTDHIWDASSVPEAAGTRWAWENIPH